MPQFPVSPTTYSELLERMSRLGVREEDLEERFIKSSGPGGQKVNKSASSVYLIHRPTGVAVKCQKVRSQTMNRFYARRILLDKIERMHRGVVEAEQERIRKIRRQKQRRSRRLKERILGEKKRVATKKRLRARIHTSGAETSE